MKTNVKQLDISNFLPHRAPFLMVDKVLSIDDEHVETSFTIKSSNILVENNCLTEVGLIENAAQTCSSIVGKSFFDDDDLTGERTKLIGFISAIKKVTLISLPKVDDTITTKAVLQSRLDTDAYSICTLQCVISCEDKELLSCKLNLVIQELK